MLIVIILLIFSLLKVSVVSPYYLLRYDFPLAMRVIMLLSLALALTELAKSDLIFFERKCRKILSFNFYFLCFNVLIGYIGLGHHTYPSTNVGFKGFFIAGNELSALFICLSVFHLYFFLDSSLKYNSYYKKFAFALSSILVMVVGLSIATKSAAVSGLLIPVILLFLSKTKSKLQLVFSIIFIFFSTVSILYITYKIALSFSDTSFISRAMYFYEQNGIFGLVFSGRQELLSIYLSSLTQSNEILDYILGVGHTVLTFTTDRSIIEIDLFDLLMYFGIPIAIIFLCFSLLTVIMPVVNFDKISYSRPIILSSTLLLIFSFVAGHVWTSSLLAISWCLALNLYWIRPENTNKLQSE